MVLIESLVVVGVDFHELAPVVGDVARRFAVAGVVLRLSGSVVLVVVVLCLVVEVGVESQAVDDEKACLAGELQTFESGRRTVLVDKRQGVVVLRDGFVGVP